MTDTALNPIRHELLSDREATVEHAFFTRDGGVSEGIYRGLNTGIGSDDDRAAVLENRRRASAWFAMEPHALVSVHQVHSPDAVTVTAPFSLDERPKADAMVTDQPNLILGILTADCGPVLFADRKAAVIGAAHAGWKGAFTGILENTVAAMEALGASRSDITAVLGPCISQANYEVGPEFVARLVSADPGHARFFIPSEKPDHAMFDLPGFTLDRLEKAGVEAAWTGDCTYADEDRFFSYRRTTHRNEPDYGRDLSAIMLR